MARIIISPETSQEIRDEVGSRRGTVRQAIMKRIAKRLGVTVHCIVAHAAKRPGVVGVHQSPILEAPARTIKATLGVAVDAFKTTMPTGTLDSLKTPGDSLAELLFMQTEIVGWAKANEDDQLLLRELASKIATLIIDLEQTQAMHKLASENQSVTHQLNSALAQVERLQALIDTEREHKRRDDNPSTYGK
jgi:hypothetical protein